MSPGFDLAINRKSIGIRVSMEIAFLPPLFGKSSRSDIVLNGRKGEAGAGDLGYLCASTITLSSVFICVRLITMVKKWLISQKFVPQERISSFL